MISIERGERRGVFEQSEVKKPGMPGSGCGYQETCCRNSGGAGLRVRNQRLRIFVLRDTRPLSMKIAPTGRLPFGKADFVGNDHHRSRAFFRQILHNFLSTS